jgi:Quinohemoprotein amine dehydrogenase, alpha subunit domain III
VAKVTQPFLGHSASGVFRQLLAFRNAPQHQVVAALPLHYRPPTGPMRDARDVFRQALADWRALDPQTRPTWPIYLYTVYHPGAAPPTLTSVTPDTWTPLATPTISLIGTALDSVTALLLPPGVTATNYATADPEHATVDLSLSCDATPGPAAIAAEAPNGTSDPYAVTIADYPLGDPQSTPDLTYAAQVPSQDGGTAQWTNPQYDRDLDSLTADAPLGPGALSWALYASDWRPNLPAGAIPSQVRLSLTHSSNGDLGIYRAKLVVAGHAAISLIADYHPAPAALTTETWTANLSAITADELNAASTTITLQAKSYEAHGGTKHYLLDHITIAYQYQAPVCP